MWRLRGRISAEIRLFPRFLLLPGELDDEDDIFRGQTDEHHEPARTSSSSLHLAEKIAVNSDETESVYQRHSH